LIQEPVHRSEVCDHLVQVYREPSELADAAAIFLAAGFDAGEPAVVVATAAHWPLFRAALEKRGWNTDELEAERMLFVADADETLAAILDDGQPSLRRFTDVIGGLMDLAAGNQPDRRLRAFGEMVDLLFRRGEPAAADALEELWNRLGSRRNFSLLCGYKIDVFDRQAEISLLPQVCRSHSHVLPAPDADRMERAVDAALVEVLGDDDAAKVYAHAARQLGEHHVPRSQLALMWVSAHMPRAAERILETAREYYLGAAAA
jgi:DcmR-like sensory protein